MLSRLGLTNRWLGSKRFLSFRLMQSATRSITTPFIERSVNRLFTTQSTGRSRARLFDGIEFSPLKPCNCRADPSSALPKPLNALDNFQTVRVPGSGGREYTIRRVGLTFDCSCPGWKLQKLKPPNKRTCKHLTAYLGEDHERARTHTVTSTEHAAATAPAAPRTARKPRTSKTAAAPAIPPASASASASASTSTSTAASPPAATTVAAAEPTRKPRAPRKSKTATATATATATTVETKDVATDNGAASAAGVVAGGEGIGLLLAKTWDGKSDPSGWWVSEKLDGVRAVWNGRGLWSRTNNQFFVPDWFVAGLPNDVTLDGEIFGGRGEFQTTVGIAKTQDDANPQWKTLTYQIFDAPSLRQPFEARYEFVQKLVSSLKDVNPYVRFVAHEKCESRAHLTARLRAVMAASGEGLMLRQPESYYVGARSATLLKVKDFEDAEAKVTAHHPGGGKYGGMLGALQVAFADGVTCKVGSGLTDANRKDPPPIGSIVTVRFQGKSRAGTPRFPRFAGQRFDVKWPPSDSATAASTAEAAAPTNPAAVAAAGPAPASTAATSKPKKPRKSAKSPPPSPVT